MTNPTATTGTHASITATDRDRWLTLCPSLTDRQIEVGALLVRGASDQDIARDLGISPSTVKNHSKALLVLCGVHNRTALAYVYGGGMDPYHGPLTRPDEAQDDSGIAEDAIPRWAWLDSGRAAS